MVMLQVLNVAFLIGVLLWLVACFSTAWLWGGSKRNAPGQLAAGLLMLVSGTLFIHVAVINAFARMDNAYLGNGLLGSVLILSGAILLFVSLAGYGVPVWIAWLLLVGYGVFGWFGLPVIARAIPIPIPDGSILLFATILILGVLLYAIIRGHILDVLVAVAPTAVGLVLTWLIYGAGWQAFTPVDSIEGAFVKPPVLDFGPFLACLVIAAALFVVGHFIPRVWQRPASASSSRASYVACADS